MRKREKDTNTMITYTVVNAMPQVKRIPFAVTLAFALYSSNTSLIFFNLSFTMMFFAVLINHRFLAHRFFVTLWKEKKRRNRKTKKRIQRRVWVSDIFPKNTGCCSTFLPFFANWMMGWKRLFVRFVLLGHFKQGDAAVEWCRIEKCITVQ